MVQTFPRGLAITAVAAKDLAKRKRFGAQDPYLAFYIQGRRKFTRVAVKGGVKPEWNQTIKYNRVNNTASREESSLIVYCINEKTGIRMGSSDRLIGSCEIDLKQTLFNTQDGLFEGWFQLMYDGKESGQVHLRLQLCEPTEEEDAPEDAPLRLDHKNRIVKSKATKNMEKSKASTPTLSNSNKSSTTNLHGALSSSSSAVSSSANGFPNGGVQRVPTARLNRPKSMADLSEERQSTIKFQEPAQRRMGSRSLEEVRNMASVTPPLGSSDGDSHSTMEGEGGDEESKRSTVSSPKQTFTLQDSNGNINTLNLLTAPFDPNWLEPTPQILKRALTAQFYYDDLQRQMAANPRDLFPRPQSQQGHNGGYPGGGEPLYMPNGQQLQPTPPHQQQFQSFGQSQQPQVQAQQQASNAQLHVSSNHLPQQLQQQPQSGQSGFPTGMSVPVTTTQPHVMGSSQPWSQHPPPLPQSTVAYQPHTVFQPRQSSQQQLQPPRSRMDMSGTSKYMSLPSRNNIPPQQMQLLRSAGEIGSNQQAIATSQPGGMVATLPQPQLQPSIPPTAVNALGPAAGYMPSTYSQEHQQALSNQLPQSAPAIHQPRFQPHLGPERPGTSTAYYSNVPSSATHTGPSLMSSPGEQQPLFASPVAQQQPPYTHHQQPTQQQQPATSHQHLKTSSFSGMETFNTMHKSPAAPVLPKTLAKARDAIFQQYMPRPVTWDGTDILESVGDPSIGRRILNKYALGMTREKYVREGFYTTDGKSPALSTGQAQHPQFQQVRAATAVGQRQPQRQFTTDQDGKSSSANVNMNNTNDRVILKWLKSKREWEIDSVMMRYLTCPHPEERLDSPYVDYAQPQQHSMSSNPFVVGLYETFMHPTGSMDVDILGGCRYLSVVQWFPETLQGYINDSIASGEGVEVTLPIVRSLIECVAWIHGRKVCHLNIKPSNFVRDPYAASSVHRMQSYHGQGWKLVDFEAARVIGEEIVGRCTFSYAAPEILIGNSTGAGVLAKGSLDIWSLGLVIYELLTDQPLFRTDDHAKDVLLGNSNGTTRPIKPIRYYDSKHVPAEYHLLLDAMLVHDPEKRLSAFQLLQLELFTKPISAKSVTQDQLIRNNSILSLRDLKATRLCNLKISGNSHGQFYGDYEEGPRSNGSHGSTDSAYGSLTLSSSQQQMMLLEGIGRVLDSPFDQVPRLFMVLPPMHHDLDPTQPFLPTNLFQNKSLRLILLCEGLSGYGEDAHVTDHRGYVLQDPQGFVQDVGRLLLHFVAVAGTNNPGYETPGLDRPLTRTGTPLDNCQRWYPSLRSYYEILQGALQKQLDRGNAVAPGLNELRALRGPTLKLLEQWLARMRRRQCQAASGVAAATVRMGSVRSKLSKVAESDLISHRGLPLGGHGYDDLSGYFANGVNISGEGAGQQQVEVDEPEVTGPGGGEGYGGLFKMPVGTCGDRWICRGCVSKQMMMAARETTSSV
ncbi:Cell division protein kinase 1 [Mortierella claussenii]|nr:Cell division protein kinase 1 [Mortierella claussenii]